MRIAHLTDLHLSPRSEALPGAQRAVAKATDLGAEAILFGGDMILDAYEQPHEKVEAEWQVARDLMLSVSLPVFPCLGNHDIWTQGREWNREWAMREMGMTQRYYATDLGDWRLIVLDSTHPVEEGAYTAKLDREQFDFLKGALAASDRPTVILSHIPILSAAVFFDGNNELTGDWSVPGAWMHVDARRIKDLLIQHPQVKVCLSGHIHLDERVDYRGIAFINSGAVCGAWWNGSYQETVPGFGLLDLHPDGRFDWRYVSTD